MHTTFIERAWPASAGSRNLIRLTTIMFAGTLLLTLSAKLHVPFFPVPMTMQTAVVFLTGLALGPKLATGTVLLYLAEGALGLPVFSGTPDRGIGLAYMAGPTGGYLAGFVVAAWICGLAAKRGSRRLALAFHLIVAALSIYVCGLAWLATFTGTANLFAVGVYPFILGDITKVLLVVVLIETGVHRPLRRS
ncbi:MAG: biotin transporter BioY [Geminicoccaceae bacterium]